MKMSAWKVWSMVLMLCIHCTLQMEMVSDDLNRESPVVILKTVNITTMPQPKDWSGWEIRSLTQRTFLPRNHKLNGIIKWRYEKRPFCNAFTGCGKKRSSLPPYPLWKRAEIDEPKIYNNVDLSEGLSDLIDINAEPAVENVQKQIMSQAKIFEAIKEASKEIFRQKSMQKLRQREENQDTVEGV